MRWKKKVWPKVGTFRVVKKFAWLPVEIGDSIVWLELYEVNQRLETSYWDSRYYWSDRELRMIEKKEASDEL